MLGFEFLFLSPSLGKHKSCETSESGGICNYAPGILISVGWAGTGRENL